MILCLINDTIEVDRYIQIIKVFAYSLLITSAYNDSYSYVMSAMFTTEDYFSFNKEYVDIWCNQQAISIPGYHA